MYILRDNKSYRIGKRYILEENGIKTSAVCVGCFGSFQKIRNTYYFKTEE